MIFRLKNIFLNFKKRIQFKKVSWPVVKNMQPELSTDTFVSVQPLTEKIHSKFFTDGITDGIEYVYAPEKETDIILNKNVKLKPDQNSTIPISWIKYSVQWESLTDYVKNKLRPVYNSKTDQVCKFRSDDYTWNQLAGREGYVIVRDGMITNTNVLTVMS